MGESFEPWQPLDTADGRDLQGLLDLGHRLFGPVGLDGRHHGVEARPAGFEDLHPRAVAVVPPDLPLAPHEPEVADWFEARLAFLLDPANQRRECVLFEGAERHYYRIDWNGRNIWGATAAMLVNLSRRLRWS